MTKRRVNDRSTELPSSKEIDRSKRACKRFILKRWQKEMVICRKCRKKRVNVGFGYCRKCAKEMVVKCEKLKP